jgi:radical SAM superfamily enzyme YgiQ (UPF0313 family)
MKLLFVSANRLKRAMPPMPLGLASIIGQIDESRHEIQLLDLMFSDDPEADTKSALSGFDPELIAISIRNIDNQCSFNTEYFLPEAKELIELCREHSDARIVIGGAAFTVSPAATFEYLEPDIGIAGEGEIAFRELLERIEQNADWSDLPGMVWRGSDGIRVNPLARVEDLDSLRPPRRELFDNQRYAAQGGFANMVSKQGCPFRCLYCDSPHVLGPRWRMKSPEKVADELESIQKDIGVGLAFLTDAVFNHPLEYAREVCEAIMRRKLSIGWLATVHPAFVRRDFLQLMGDAGCRAVSLGCDTASERMLEVLRKDFTKQQLGAALDLLEEMRMPYILSVLIGGPGEDRETVEETVDFLSNRTPLMLDFCIGIRLMPHTRLAEIAIEEGVISADEPLMEPRFYVSPHVQDWISDYLGEVCAGRPGWGVAYESIRTQDAEDIVQEASHPKG